ncbi:23865_t:CDS:2, partial [Dentiscutata erythropus]
QNVFSKRKDKTTLTNKQRQDIITYKSKHPNISNVELVDWVKKEFKLDVHPSTIGCLIKNKEDIEKKAKTFAQMLEIPNFKFLQSWLYKFKKRHKLGWVKKHEEDVSMDDTKKKKDLEQLILALCANADGTDKIKIFVIGVNRNGLGIKYDASHKAWITTILFQKWLKEFDLKMAGRKIILLLDSAKLLDKYKAEKYEKINVLDAIRFIARAWREVTPETICNCFQYTGIFPDTQDNEESFEYINYPEEKDIYEVLSDKEILDLATNLEPENKSAKDNNSTEMRQISHQEALNAVEILEQYIVQNDFSEIIQAKHDEALLKLQKEIRKL